MNQKDHTTSNNQLSRKNISYLNSNLTKKGKLLLLTLYKYQPLKHKDLAKILDMQTNGLTNLITNINEKIYNDLIKSEHVGRCKFYSLSQIAETYTENILLPEETVRKNALTSFLHNDFLVNDVLDSLRKFQEFEGDDWDIVLDDLLFAETRNMLASTANAKEAINQIHFNYFNYKEETYQNYNTLKNALITLIIQRGKQSAQKVYEILDQKILSRRLDTLLSNILDDFYKMEPLFHLEKENLQAAYSIIDKIFSDCFPETFGTNTIFYPNPLPAEFYSIYSVIINMTNEFKYNNYDKTVSIEQWEKNFHIQNHYSCISYIAEKCSTIYIRQSL